jgi:hypothetical protein
MPRSCATIVPDITFRTSPRKVVLARSASTDSCAVEVSPTVVGMLFALVNDISQDCSFRNYRSSPRRPTTPLGRGVASISAWLGLSEPESSPCRDLLMASCGQTRKPAAESDFFSIDYDRARCTSIFLGYPGKFHPSAERSLVTLARISPRTLSVRGGPLTCTMPYRTHHLEEVPDDVGRDTCGLLHAALSRDYVSSSPGRDVGQIDVMFVADPATVNPIPQHGDGRMERALQDHLNARFCWPPARSTPRRSCPKDSE